MPDFNIRSESIDVEQIMEQIRARIREKRGVDYTEEQIRELAAVKLEKLLDPRGVRSDLLERFRRVKAEHEPPDPPNYVFEEATLYETHRGAIRWIRRLLQPVLKLFFNPNPLIQALNIQSRLNTLYAQRESTRRGLDELYFEVIHNLVIETTRLGIEVKNLKMRVESLASRLDFNERRARALEGAVVYRPAGESHSEPAVVSTPRSVPDAGVSPPAASSDRPLPSMPQVSTPSPGGGPTAEGPGQRSRRRRRRRGRRGGPGVGGGSGSAPPWSQRPLEAGHEASEAQGEVSEGGEAQSVEAPSSEPGADAAPQPSAAPSSSPDTGGLEPDPQ